jgi:hypothetical protein
MYRFLLAALILIPLTVSAEETAGFAFLRIPVGARSAAMGGAFTAVSGDPLALHWNPANLMSVQGGRLLSSYTGYLMDMQAGFAGWAAPRERDAFGVSLNYFNAGEFTRTTMSDPLGTGETFGSSSIALTGSYAMGFSPGLSAGMSGKLVYSKIDTYSANALMVDIGASYSLPSVQGLNTALVVRNLGIQTQAFYKENDPLPTEVAAGASMELMNGNLLLAADATVPVNGEFDVAAGAEYQVVPMLALRAGGSLQAKNSADEAGGGFVDALSFGVGTGWNRFSLDYAFKPFADLGEVHRAGLAYRL